MASEKKHIQAARPQFFVLDRNQHHIKFREAQLCRFCDMLHTHWQAGSRGTRDGESIADVIEPLAQQSSAHVSAADQKYVHFGLQLSRFPPSRKNMGSRRKDVLSFRYLVSSPRRHGIGQFMA